MLCGTHTASIAIPWICDSSTHAAEDSGGTGKAGWLGATSAAADCDIQSSSSVATVLRLSATGKPGNPKRRQRKPGGAAERQPSAAGARVLGAAAAAEDSENSEF